MMLGIDLIFGDGGDGGNLRKADELGSKEFVAGWWNNDDEEWGIMIAMDLRMGILLSRIVAAKILDGFEKMIMDLRLSCN